MDGPGDPGDAPQPIGGRVILGRPDRFALS